MSSLSRNFSIAVDVQPQTHESQLDNLFSLMSQRGFSCTSVTQEFGDQTTALPPDQQQPSPVDRLIFSPRRPEQFSTAEQVMNMLSPLQTMQQVKGYEIQNNNPDHINLWMRRARPAWVAA